MSNSAVWRADAIWLVINGSFLCLHPSGHMRPQQRTQISVLNHINSIIEERRDQHCPRYVA